MAYTSGQTMSRPTTPVEPMTLEPLVAYTSDQTDRIEALLDNPDSPLCEPSLKCWGKLWTAVWGKKRFSETMREIQRGLDPIDDSILPDGVPTVVNVMIQEVIDLVDWDPMPKNILIRPEYKIAEDFILSSCGAVPALKAVVIAGQPGIGLSPFCSATTRP